MSTSNDELVAEINPEAFPNPTSGEFKLEFDLEQSERVSVELLNVEGKMIQQIVSNEWLNSYSEQLNFDDLPNGTYFSNVKTLDKSRILPLILEK